MPAYHRRYLLLLAMFLTTACASGGSSGGAGDYDVLTGEAIENVRRLNALEAVQRLRPRWLRVRGPDSFSNPSAVSIYVNGSRRGGPGSLTRIPMQNVERMEYLDAREATLRFGTGNAAGAILVTTRR